MNKKDKSIVSVYLRKLEEDKWIKIYDRHGKRRKIKPMRTIGKNQRYPLEKTNGSGDQPLEKTKQSNIIYNIYNSNIKSNKKSFAKSENQKDSAKKCEIPNRKKGLQKQWCNGVRKFHYCPGEDYKLCMSWFNQFIKKVDFIILKKGLCSNINKFKKSNKYYPILTNQLRDYMQKDNKGFYEEFFRKWKNSN